MENHFSDLGENQPETHGTPNQSKFKTTPVKIGVNKSEGLSIFKTNNAIEPDIKMVAIARGSFMNSAIKSGNVRPMDRGLLTPISTELVSGSSSAKDDPVVCRGFTSV